MITTKAVAIALMALGGLLFLLARKVDKDRATDTFFVVMLLIALAAIAEVAGATILITIGIRAL